MKDLIELIAENDQWNIKAIHERINLANEWKDKVYGIVNSDKELSDSEWETHKLLALEYINHLKEIADPSRKIFLHLQENQTTSEYLSKRLEQTLNIAVDRLTACINVIEGKIKKSREATDKWNEMCTYLTNKSFINTRPEVFNFVMEHRHLLGTKKIQWLSYQSDALYIFFTLAKFSISEINKCFRSKNGNPFQKGSVPRRPHKPELTFVKTFFKE